VKYAVFHAHYSFAGAPSEEAIDEGFLVGQFAAGARMIDERIYSLNQDHISALDEPE
jgi:hypothetical protein